MPPEPPLTGPEALAVVLEAQASVFSELALLADRQRRALLDADAAELERLAGRSETIATRFRLLEAERERLERQDAGDGNERVERARQRSREALVGLLREAAISGTVLARFGDTLEARRAAVSALVGTIYLPNGRRAPVAPRAGRALCAEG